MKKQLVSGLMMAAAVTLLTGCHMSHEWQEAACTTLQTCSVCGKTKGELAEHAWQEATCAAPKTCSVCSKTEGETLEHTWAEASCAAPKTCSVCGKTEGEALEHTWVEATYTEPKTCSVCGETEGEPRQQPYVEANNLSFSQETSFTMQGVRYDTDDRSNYEYIDMQLQIEDASVEENPEEDFRTVYLTFVGGSDIWSDGQGHRRLSLSVPGPVLYDMYTGRKLPAARMQDDMQVESEVELEWEGKPYTINTTYTTKWIQGDWRGEYSKLNVHCNYEIKIPKDYDGLVFTVQPITEWSVEVKEAGVVDETEEYLMDNWTDGSLLFRVEDFLK